MAKGWANGQGQAPYRQSGPPAAAPRPGQLGPGFAGQGQLGSGLCRPGPPRRGKLGPGQPGPGPAEPGHSQPGPARQGIPARAILAGRSRPGAPGQARPGQGRLGRGRLRVDTPGVPIPGWPPSARWGRVSPRHASPGRTPVPHRVLPGVNRAGQAGPGQAPPQQIALARPFQAGHCRTGYPGQFGPRAEQPGRMSPESALPPGRRRRSEPNSWCRRGRTGPTPTKIGTPEGSSPSSGWPWIRRPAPSTRSRRLSVHRHHLPVSGRRCRAVGWDE